MVSIGVPPYTHINLGHGTCSVHSLEISTSQQPTSVEIAFLCNSCIVSSMILGWPTLVLSSSILELVEDHLDPQCVRKGLHVI